jgi:photosystem II stability/assembly factor-like uncharacterized protein
VVASPTVAYATGVKGTLLVTGDAGHKWKAIPTRTADDLFSVFAVGDKIYVGGEHPLVSRDLGKTWTKLDTLWLPFFGGTEHDLYSWGFGQLHHSIDGGKTWASVPTHARVCR